MLRCVLVDDSPSVLSVCKALLERQRISVVGLASSQAQALELIANTDPDVALVDIDLGGDSGFEVVARIAGDPALARTRSVLISAHDGADLVELIEDSPALGFISKTDLSGDAVRAVVGRA